MPPVSQHVKREVIFYCKAIAERELQFCEKFCYCLSGTDEQELATPILGLCHGIFTD